MVRTRRIALHLPSLAGAGAERVNLLLAAAFRARGLAVDLVLCQATGAFLDQIPPGCRLVDLAAPRTLASLRPLRRYLAHTQPDALLASLNHQNLAALLARIGLDTPTRVFVSLHGVLSLQARKKKIDYRVLPLAYRLLLPRAAGVIAVSAGVADDLARAAGFPRSRITVLHNPALPPDLDRLAAEPVDDPFFSAPGPLAVGVGRLVPQKGFDVLLDALALARRRTPVRLALCGAVRFLGHQANPFRFVARADVFVLSSRYEGFGNVLVEALGCGVPVVSTDCPSGPAEILAGGRHGTLVPVEDAPALAAALVRAVRERPDRAGLRARAADFAVEAAAERYLDRLLPEWRQEPIAQRERQNADRIGPAGPTSL